MRPRPRSVSVFQSMFQNQRGSAASHGHERAHSGTGLTSGEDDCAPDALPDALCAFLGMLA
jgi:hypothetical protein